MTSTRREDDQEAAARREADRAAYKAWHNGHEVTLRAVTVEVTSGEAEALARGEVPPAVQTQLDRQGAEDVAIAELEKELNP